jgi:hypothetical protein
MAEVLGPMDIAGARMESQLWGSLSHAFEGPVLGILAIGHPRGIVVSIKAAMNCSYRDGRGLNPLEGPGTMRVKATPPSYRPPLAPLLSLSLSSIP